MTVTAHFDGTVITPDEPLVLQIQTPDGEIVPSEDWALSWIAANAVESSSVPTGLADRHNHYLYEHSTSSLASCLVAYGPASRRLLPIKFTS
jgi:hypothetical protein